MGQKEKIMKRTKPSLLITKNASEQHGQAKKLT